MNDDQIDPVSDIERALDQAQQERRNCVHHHLNKNKLRVKEEVWTPWYTDLLIDSGDLHDGKMEIVAHEVYGSLMATDLDCEVGDIRIDTPVYGKLGNLQTLEPFGHGLCAVRLLFYGPTRGVRPEVPDVVNGAFVSSSHG